MCLRLSEAWADHAEGKNDEALRLLSAIAEKQQTGVFGANGDLPAREMRADMLLDMHHPEEALSEYQTELRITPNRFDSLYGAGRAAELANQEKTAVKYYWQLVESCTGGASTRPELAHARDFLGKTHSL
jgi:tetratricopeptide (TPR) repeat protein